jgi:isopentenyl-diphosphate Delta-isomerase
MTKIIIVDEQDNIIGSKERTGEIKEGIYRVSALWITNSKGQVLLARRQLDKAHDPGAWGPAVAGTVEEGEIYDFNIVKEAEEELGLKNIKFEKGKKVRVRGKYNYFCQWFLLKLDKKAEDFKFDKKEVLEVKWFSKQEILEMSKNPKMLTSTHIWVDLFCK